MPGMGQMQMAGYTLTPEQQQQMMQAMQGQALQPPPGYDATAAPLAMPVMPDGAPPAE